MSIQLSSIQYKPFIECFAFLLTVIWQDILFSKSFPSSLFCVFLVQGIYSN